MRPLGLGVLICCFWVAVVSAQVNVTTFHYDNSRTGQNINETVLTPSNVNSNQFGKLFSVTVDGQVYAHPLYLSNVQIAGGQHNVVFVATEHDSLYAIDADTGTLYWQVSFIPSGGSTVDTSVFGCQDLIPEAGITSTPVIDTSSNTIYVLSRAKASNGTYAQYLHAIDVATHVEKFGGPVVIQASGPGTTVTFDPLWENNRAGLLLQNGHILIAWASLCDQGPYHGWVISYTAGTLTQNAVFNVTPNGSEGGIWMSGAGLAGDANFNTFFATGNGTFDGSSNFGDSIVKLGSPSGGTFPVLDFFTPFNQSSLSLSDLEVGSGGVLLLPDLPAGSAHPHLLVQASKEGKIYLIDRDNMGHFCSTCTTSDTQIVQELSQVVGNGMWAMPAYWNGNVYFGGDGDAVKAFSFNAGGSGLLSSFPTSRSSTSYSFPGATPTVSANGTSNGILWAIQTDAFGFGGPAILRAYDATNLATELYNSNQNSSRDNPGPANKFAVPVVANGKVYVAAVGKLSVYGLLNAGTRAATTTALSSSPNPSTFGQAVTFTATVTSATAGARTGLVTFFDGTTSLGTGSLNTGGIATLQFTFQSAGQHSLSAQYGGDSNFAGSTSPAVTQTVNSANSASDFSASASPPSASVNPGGVASFTLTLNPVGGFTGAVSVNCSGAPPASACTASPSSVTLNGSNSASVTVQIATSTAGSVGASTPSMDDNQWAWLLLLQLTSAAAVAIGSRRKRILGIAAATALLLVASCGNGGGIATSAPKQATPSGIYTVTLTAAAGTTTHSTTVQLKVN